MAFAGSFFLFNLYINLSASLPRGVYRAVDGDLQRGSYVLFCPPRSAVFDEARQRGYIGAGFCDGSYGYMMKKILAAKSDRVSVSDDGMRVNGELVPNSQPLACDLSGRLLPRYRTGEFVLAEGELMLGGITAKSFDSRYFGPIHSTQVRSVLEPIFVFRR